MAPVKTSSKLHSVFLASVASGAGGLAIADTLFGGSTGGIGFLVGLVSAFVLLSLLLVISEAGAARVEDTGSVRGEEDRLSQTHRSQVATKERTAQTIAKH